MVGSPEPSPAVAPEHALSAPDAGAAAMAPAAPMDAGTIADAATAAPLPPAAAVPGEALQPIEADRHTQTQRFVADIAAPSPPAAATNSVALGRELLTRIGNQSNLILDPDLDSYYTMSLVVLRFPELLDVIDQMRRLAHDMANGLMNAAR